MECADFFGEEKYRARARVLLQNILDHQSGEGWFLEYEGADPGYQTLCMYYLAQVYKLDPNEKLLESLRRATDFLACFVHPDGSFAGEYGSRRTAIYYPGGLALLQQEIPLARSITQFMVQSIVNGSTVTLDDVDIANLAPLLASTTLLLDTLDGHDRDSRDGGDSLIPPLPWQEDRAERDFPETGLYVRSTSRHYAICGVSNGGVLKVFDRAQQRLLWNDGGYVGETQAGVKVTTQITDLRKECQVTGTKIKVRAPFYQMLHATPTPMQFVLLRILNLTVMRSIWLGNLVKALLVRLLISGKRSEPLTLSRLITFEAEQIIIEDQLTTQRPLQLRWLVCGGPFVAIHMASSRYFQGFSSLALHPPSPVDVTQLNSQGTAHLRIVL
jgi:hypothetical protein